MKLVGEGMLPCLVTGKQRAQTPFLFWCTQSNADICTDPLTLGDVIGVTKIIEKTLISGKLSASAIAKIIIPSNR